MQILTSKRSMLPFISLVLIFALGVTTSMAQQKIKIAGKMTCAVIERKMIDVGDTEGHSVSLGEYEGANVSTGKQKFMDAAQVAGMTFGDLVKGNGPHQGYGKMSLDGDVVFWESEGKTTTTLSPEGRPITTFEGTLSYIKGTGQFENIQGSGTYNGMYISRTIWTLEWKGEYSIKK